MTRAIGYARVSTGQQAEKGMGLDAQRRKIREHAKAHGLELLDVVQEAASGAVKEGEVFSHAHRPVLTDLLDRAGRGEFDVLLVAAFDRLSRDHLTLIFLKRQLKAYGVQAVSATEEANGNGDPFAEFMDTVIAAVAELERKRILERVRGGKAEKKGAGKHVHGRVPYGYRSTSGTLRPDPERAPTVVRIFDEAKAGRSPGRIANALNADDVPGPTGGAWNRGTVRGILENPAYAGERYDVKKAHEPIVSRRTFNSAQTALATRQRGGD